MVLVAQDLDLVAGLQMRHQRHDGAVDLGADRGVANIGMKGIGEVDRRRTARQRDQPAAWREAEHLVLEELELGVFEEVFLARTAGHMLDSLAQPGEGLALVGELVEIARDHTLLVERMRRDAVLRDPVHLVGADL